MIRPLSLATIAFALPLIAGGPIQGPPAQHRTDWLVATIAEPARVVRHDARHEIELTNGLISRVWRLAPDAATIALDNLVTGQALVRGVKPEAIVELDGVRHPVGGLLGQPDYAYLRARVARDDDRRPGGVSRCTGSRPARPTARFAWGKVRRAGRHQWPPAGVVPHAAVRVCRAPRSAVSPCSCTTRCTTASR